MKKKRERSTCAIRPFMAVWLVLRMWKHYLRATVQSHYKTANLMQWAKMTALDTDGSPQQQKKKSRRNIPPFWASCESAKVKVTCDQVVVVMGWRLCADSSCHWARCIYQWMFAVWRIVAILVECRQPLLRCGQYGRGPARFLGFAAFPFDRPSAWPSRAWPTFGSHIG